MLESRLNELRRRFLPKDLDPTKAYERAQVDRARAYTVLAHAEIEQFLEDICQTATLRALNEWNNGKRIGRSTVALAAFVADKRALPDKLAHDGAPSLTQKLEGAQANHTTYLRTRNNGIAENHLIQMLLPLGLMESEFPAGLVDKMNELRAKRGAVAHTSASGKIEDKPHPHTEYLRVTGIVNDLSVIDTRLRTLAFR